MAKQPKHKGEEAKPETRWTLVILCDGKPWINPHFCSFTRADCKGRVLASDIRGFNEANYGKTWTVRKVTITLAP